MATKKRKTPSGDLWSPHDADEIIFETPHEWRWFKGISIEYPETFGYPISGDWQNVQGWRFPSDPRKGRIAEALQASHGQVVGVKKVAKGRDPSPSSRRTAGSIHYILKEESRNKKFPETWTSSEVFKARNVSEVKQAVSSAWTSGTARWAEGTDGSYIYGIDSRGNPVSPKTLSLGRKY